MNMGQAATRLGLSISTVQERIRTGKLFAVKDGSRIIITEEDIAEYSRCHRIPQGPKAAADDLAGLERHYGSKIVVGEADEG